MENKSLVQHNTCIVVSPKIWKMGSLNIKDKKLPYKWVVHVAPQFALKFELLGLNFVVTP